MQVVGEDDKKKNEKLWELMKAYLGTEVSQIERQIVNHVEYTCAKTRFNFNIFNAFQATAYSVRDRLIERLNDTNELVQEEKMPKEHFLSAEFMLGRLLKLNLVNLGLEKNFREAL